MGGLYERDFYAWTEEQAALLRAGRTDALDLEHLAEEVEGMSVSQRRELMARLVVLLTHLLKWQLEPELQSRSWRATILTQRQELEDLLEQSPSLRRLVDGMLPRAYAKAVTRAEQETGIEAGKMPARCPFTREQILGDWLPG
jgi:hypothetical protein